jgi:phage tail protein X
VWPALEEQRVALYAISYDTPETLGRFAVRNQIGYRLLSDVGSSVIDQLGVLDRDLDAHHAEFGRETRVEQRGVAYPSVFVLDADGVVTERRNQHDYRTRESGASLFEEATGITLPTLTPQDVAADGVVRATASLDVRTVARYQRFRAVVELDIDPAWHVYGAPAPEGCVELDLVAEPESGLAAEQAVVPAPAIQPDGSPGYSGRVRVRLPLSYRVEAGGGDRELVLWLSYQACSEATCLPPARARMVVPVPIEDVPAP